MARKLHKSTRKPAPVGRPTTYDPAYCDKIIDHMANGGSVEAFAGLVRTSVPTLYRWVDQFPEFRKAKEDGEALSRVWWEDLGKRIAAGVYDGEPRLQRRTIKPDGAVEEIYGPPTPSAAVWIFNMKNRFRWRDQVVHESPDGGPLELVLVQQQAPEADK